MPITVDLANATGAAVYVDIVDHTGLLVDAASGTPGDGASVEGYTLAADNVDAKTLKLTWIDFPIDNGLVLYIDRVDGHLRLLLIQPEPSGTTDAIGFDRELVLTFSQPLSAELGRDVPPGRAGHARLNRVPDPVTESVSPGQAGRRSRD